MENDRMYIQKPRGRHHYKKGGGEIPHWGKHSDVAIGRRCKGGDEIQYLLDSINLTRRQMFRRGVYYGKFKVKTPQAKSLRKGENFGTKRESGPTMSCSLARRCLKREPTIRIQLGSEPEY